jgi:type IV pilus assembly protein PilE
MSLAERGSGWGRFGRSSGITLLELLVVIAIIGILGAIAYPSYVQYVTRTHRSVAKGMLLQVADRQEQFFADNKRYAGDLTQLGYIADGFMIDDQGQAVADGDAGRLYAIALTNTSALTFTANAVPELAQATRDVRCQTLTLSHTGQRSQTGVSTDCW